MKHIFHPANERGFTKWDWLESAHSFSFGNYNDPQKTNFGKLRVLNDDIVLPGEGFDLHRHQNMEIISIPLSGSLQHKDSTGHTEIISPGEVQVMTAGRGIYHSEHNASDRETHFLQIWIIPREANLVPRYDQKSIGNIDKAGELIQLVSPNGNSESLMIEQDAYISRLNLQPDQDFTYTLKSGSHGVYAFLLEGRLSAAEKTLARRDALGIWDTEEFTLRSQTDCEILFIETPLI